MLHEPSGLLDSPLQALQGLMSTIPMWAIRDDSTVLQALQG
ncbi:hypothetical protein ACFY2K_04095 [Kitasatospora sp. NPDC001309]